MLNFRKLWLEAQNTQEWFLIFAQPLGSDRSIRWWIKDILEHMAENGGDLDGKILKIADRNTIADARDHLCTRLQMFWKWKLLDVVQERPPSNIVTLEKEPHIQLSEQGHALWESGSRKQTWYFFRRALVAQTRKAMGVVQPYFSVAGGVFMFLRLIFRVDDLIAAGAAAFAALLAWLVASN